MHLQYTGTLYCTFADQFYSITQSITVMEHKLPITDINNQIKCNYRDVETNCMYDQTGLRDMILDMQIQLLPKVHI